MYRLAIEYTQFIQTNSTCNTINYSQPVMWVSIIHPENGWNAFSKPLSSFCLFDSFVWSRALDQTGIGVLVNFTKHDSFVWVRALDQTGIGVLVNFTKHNFSDPSVMSRVALSLGCVSHFHSECDVKVTCMSPLCNVKVTWMSSERNANANHRWVLLNDGTVCRHYEDGLRTRSNALQYGLMWQAASEFDAPGSYTPATFDPDSSTYLLPSITDRNESGVYNNKFYQQWKDVRHSLWIKHRFFNQFSIRYNNPLKISIMKMNMFLGDLTDVSAKTVFIRRGDGTAGQVKILCKVVSINQHSSLLFWKLAWRVLVWKVYLVA